MAEQLRFGWQHKQKKTPLLIKIAQFMCFWSLKYVHVGLYMVRLFSQILPLYAVYAVVVLLSSVFVNPLSNSECCVKVIYIYSSMLAPNNSNPSQLHTVRFKHR